VLQVGLILQARPADEQVRRDGEDVIGLMIRQVHLEQLDGVVELLGDLEASH